MTLPRLPLRQFLPACLLLVACADERADDDTLEPQAIGSSYEALAQFPRNPHCRHWHGCPMVDAGCAHASADDAAAPQPKFTITGVAGKGGSATASSPSGTCSNAGVNWSCSVPAGSSVFVTAWAADTWRLATWSCPHGVAAGNTVTIANIQQDSDCYASFMPITFTVSYQAVDSSGTILHDVVTAYDVARGPCTDDLCRAQQHETVVLTAGPSEGLRFVGWSGCSTSTESELSLIVNADQTCVAHYEGASLPVLL